MYVYQDIHLRMLPFQAVTQITDRNAYVEEIKTTHCESCLVNRYNVAHVNSC